MKKIFFLPLALTITLVSGTTLAEHKAPTILGAYNCTGHDPHTPRDFSSTITIQKTGDVYSITEATTDNHSDVLLV